MTLMPTNCWKTARPRPTQTDPDDGGQLAADDEVTELLPRLEVDGLPDLLDLLRDRRFPPNAHDLFEHLRGLLLPATGDQVARRFGDRGGQQAVEQRRSGLEQEHPAPGLQSEPELFRRAVGDIGDEGIGGGGHEDADHDGELPGGAEASTQVGRGDLGDVGRGDHRGHADADAAEHAPEHQVHGAEGQP